MRAARIAKIAGYSLAGFVTATLVADKVSGNSVISQFAGFGGALAGTLVGRLRGSRQIAAAAKRAKLQTPPA